jgi:hypothetical protein
VTLLSNWTGPDASGQYSAPLAIDTKLLNRDKAVFMRKGTVGMLTDGQWGFSNGRVYIRENPSGYNYYAMDSSCGSIGGNNEHGGHVNAFRYFDDVYIDTSFARVMLANDSSYENATIIEPQIPSAWSGGSITAKVNLGRFPQNGRAYLFIFDANNNRSVAHCVPLGSGSCEDVTKPTAPKPAAPSLF